jgi:hypothetical protein
MQVLSCPSPFSISINPLCHPGEDDKARDKIDGTEDEMRHLEKSQNANHRYRIQESVLVEESHYEGHNSRWLHESKRDGSKIPGER